MIKFLEITSPNEDRFRQAKIIQFLVQEGDEVQKGQALFLVQKNKEEYELPAPKEGKITELIVTQGETITPMTPLLLLETVSESTEAKVETPKAKQAPPKRKKRPTKKKKKSNSPSFTQQDLNLSGSDKEIERHSQNAPTQHSTMNTTQITLPDIGTESAKVIEIHVQVGDTIHQDDTVLSLESDKASMDLPCPESGIVKEIQVKLEQDISEGDNVMVIEIEQTSSDSTPATPKKDEDQETKNDTATVIENIAIPDIGTDSAKIIDILVSENQAVTKEQTLLTLESDKASMDVPSPYTGTIKSITATLEQEVNTGDIIATMLISDATPTEHNQETQSKPTSAPAPTTQDSTPTPSAATSEQTPSNTPMGKGSHASPSIRRFARELGVDLHNVQGSGRKGRIRKTDVKQFVKAALSGTSNTQMHTSGASGIPPIPAIDFTKFGEVDIQPLNKIKKLTAENLHRAWLNIPHVTFNDEANISDLEDFRKKSNAEYKKREQSTKLSPLAFIVKASAQAMLAYPQFNSSLDPAGENLIYKKYCNIGIAVDTPNGLVVPVIKDADKKSVAHIADEMSELAKKARDKKLTIADMSGACFTISSLGGIGGTDFTPIINPPEVAILGVSRSKIQPHWNGESFVPQMMLPLSLSFDHRVIDGAEAARFTRHIADILEDIRRLTL